MPVFEVVYIGAWLLALTCNALLYESVRQAAEFASVVHDRDSGRLRIGTKAPLIEGVDASGALLQLDPSGKLVLFVSSEHVVVSPDHVRAWVQYLLMKSSGQLIVVCSGSFAEWRRFSEGLKGSNGYSFLVDSDGFIARSYRVNRSPLAVNVSRVGLITQYGIYRPSRV